MRSEAELFLYIFSISAIFLPLLWGWIRGALSLVEKLAHDELSSNPRTWYWLMNLITGCTIGLLLGMVVASIGCLAEREHFSLGSVFGAIVLTLIIILIMGAIVTIWALVHDEFVTILRRRGL